MERYDYRTSIKKDIKAYILECMDYDNVSNEDFIENSDLAFDSYYDNAFVSDRVTGNASGSYTFNTWKAEEYICHNMDLAKEAFEMFGYDGINTDSAETIDVTIRCYLLGEMWEEAVEELVEELEEA